LLVEFFGILRCAQDDSNGKVGLPLE
jgi:hypothetical protein